MEDHLEVKDGNDAPTGDDLWKCLGTEGINSIDDFKKLEEDDIDFLYKEDKLDILRRRELINLLKKLKPIANNINNNSSNNINNINNDNSNNNELINYKNVLIKEINNFNEIKEKEIVLNNKFKIDLKERMYKTQKFTKTLKNELSKHYKLLQNNEKKLNLIKNDFNKISKLDPSIGS